MNDNQAGIIRKEIWKIQRQKYQLLLERHDLMNENQYSVKPFGFGRYRRVSDMVDDMTKKLKELDIILSKLKEGIK